MCGYLLQPAFFLNFKCEILLKWENEKMKKEYSVKKNSHFFWNKIAKFQKKKFTTN